MMKFNSDRTWQLERSRYQKISLHPQAVSAESGEDESGESFSEEDFGSFGSEGLAIAFKELFGVATYQALRQTPELLEWRLKNLACFWLLLLVSIFCRRLLVPSQCFDPSCDHL